MGKLYTLFITAVRSFFKNTFNFKGVTSRTDFWLAVLFNLVSTMALAVIVMLIALSIPLFHAAYYIPDAYSLFLLVPNLSMLVRRVRDTGLSLWWIVSYFIPVIGIVILFIITLMPSKRHSTLY